MLALLVNLSLSTCAGLMFQLLWSWQRKRTPTEVRPLRRAALTVLPPVAFVYAVIVVISNASVWIQFAVLMPVLAAAFIILLILRDPVINLNEQDRRFLLSITVAVGLVSTIAGMVAALSVYISPGLPMVLPDHNLLTTWKIDFVELGYSREEALAKLNLGYMWHAMCVFAYMVFAVGAALIAEIYGVGRRSAHNLEPSRRTMLGRGTAADP
jgi:hypothetical protein